jgi:hypothetical protein
MYANQISGLQSENNDLSVISGNQPDDPATRATRTGEGGARNG